MADLDVAIRAALDDFCTTDWCAEKGRAAIEGVLELHPVGYPGNEVEYDERDEPAFDGSGRHLGYMRVKGDAVPPYWCKTCDEMAPCPTVQALARGLGIEA